MHCGLPVVWGLQYKAFRRKPDLGWTRSARATVWSKHLASIFAKDASSECGKSVVVGRAVGARSHALGSTADNDGGDERL